MLIVAKKTIKKNRIDVTDPELMKKITTHPDIDRIHGVPTKDKPW